MGYGDNFERAREKASELIDTLPDGSFGIVRPLVGAEKREALALRAVIGAMREGTERNKDFGSFTDNEKRLEEAYSALEGAPGRIKRSRIHNGPPEKRMGERKIRQGLAQDNRRVGRRRTCQPRRNGHGASAYGKDSVTLGLSVSNFSDKAEKRLLASVSAGGKS